MIEKALKYIVGLQGGYEIVEQKGRTYTVNKNGEIATEFSEKLQKQINTSTLKSIVDYFAGDPDGLFATDKQYVIVIDSVKCVFVFSSQNAEKARDSVLVVSANVPREFPYERFMDTETFNIMLQSRFEETEDRQKLLALTGTVIDETVKSYNDDGVSQQATIKSGVSSVANVVVPNPVILKPFRTFSEAEQPESKFIFRLKKDEDGIKAALFEADGGAWQAHAIQNIFFYLDSRLTARLTAEQRERITILA